MTDMTPTTEENIRLILGASGENAILLSTLDIDHALTLYPDWRLAGAFLADALAARAINNPLSFALTGTLAVSWADRANTWLKIAKSLRTEVQYAIQQSLEPMGLTAQLLEREYEELSSPPEYRTRNRYSRGFT